MNATRMNDHFIHPHRCPYCGREDVDGGAVDIDATTARQTAGCAHCQRHWTDLYQLTGLIDDAGQVHRPEQADSAKTAAIPDRDIRQRELVPPDRLAATRATVIGVGAIGRQVALQLAAMGVPHLQLIDPDTVEPANLAAQGYMDTDLGRPKVQATAVLCQQLNPRLGVEEHATRFRRTMEVGNAVFMCVDSIDTRRHIWHALRDRAPFIVDGRMNAETLRILAAADERSREHYPSTLFPAAEAHTGACTARSTIYTANIAAGLMVHQLTRHLRGLPLEPDSVANLLAGEWTVADTAADRPSAGPGQGATDAQR